MKIYTKKEIAQAIDIPHLIEELEKGFILYSEGKSLISPVGFLHFEHPRGDVHIKSGAILQDTLYVVKIASGFYDNPKLGLPSTNGVMLLFSQKTGSLEAILLDEGMLTDLRTALAGAIFAKYLAPKTIHKIGIIGTGVQAKEQLFYLTSITSCREAVVFGRSQANINTFINDPRLSHFHIKQARSIDALASECNLIITATNSDKPFLYGDQLQPGTHITALGADQIGKQELDPSVFERADLIVVDSLAQCRSYGDLSHIKECSTPIIEIGTFLKEPHQRENNKITVSDLTGIAIQDLQIAKAVFTRLELGL